MGLSFCPPHSKCLQNCLNKDKKGLCTFSTQMVESNKINIKGELPCTRSSVAMSNKGRKKEETSAWKGSGLEVHPSGGVQGAPSLGY